MIMILPPLLIVSLIHKARNSQVGYVGGVSLLVRIRGGTVQYMVLGRGGWGENISGSGSISCVVVQKRRDKRRGGMSWQFVCGAAGIAFLAYQPNKSAPSSSSSSDITLPNSHIPNKGVCVRKRERKKKACLARPGLARPNVGFGGGRSPRGISG
jgi:hypothetical protein